MPTRPRVCRGAATGVAALAGWLLCASTTAAAPIDGAALLAGGVASPEHEARSSLGEPSAPALPRLSLRGSLPGTSGRAILRLPLRAPRSALLLPSPSSWADASLGSVDLSDPRAVLEIIRRNDTARSFVAARRD